MTNSRNLHAIILAGDEDPRLFPLTQALSGRPLPKQFAFIAGDGSLLQQAVTPYAALMSPERITVVVSTKHEEVARTQLRPWRGICLLARPSDRGPAVDMLLALGRIVARGTDATVIVAPAHHYVPKANALVGSLIAAEPALSSIPVLVAGAAMNGRIVGERLMVPGPRLAGRVLSVERSVASVPPTQAGRLQAQGALWDTSVFAAHAISFWKMAARALPTEAGIIANLWAAAPASFSSIGAAFRTMPNTKPAAVLWPGPRELGVVPVHGSGWNAWSSPEQVLDSLNEPYELDRLLFRIYQRQHGMDRAQTRERFRFEARQQPAPCLVRQSVIRRARRERTALGACP